MKKSVKDATEMKCFSEKHDRRSIRLKAYDYSSAGAYFVTVCTHYGKCVFGDVRCSAMWLNEYGRIVQEEWLNTARIRDNIELDGFVVMPNHFHGIIVIMERVGATRRVAPTMGLKSNSLGSIVGQFKSMAAKRIHKMGLRDFKWQRNYYEHIIRNEDDLDQIRRYIINNAVTWELDSENPENIDAVKDRVLRPPFCDFT